MTTTVNEASEASEDSKGASGEGTGLIKGEIAEKEGFKEGSKLEGSYLGLERVEREEIGTSGGKISGTEKEERNGPSGGSGGSIMGGNSVFSFKKSKLKSASINREFLSKASQPGGGGAGTVSVGLKTTGAVGGSGKPRLATKISTTISSYNLGTFSEGLFSKSLDGKPGGASGGVLGSALGGGVGSGGAVWGRNKKRMCVNVEIGY